MRRGAPVLLLVLASTASAQPDGPFAAVPDLDPLALARVIDREGDGVVLEALEGDAPPLAAIHAAPFLRAPEQALGPLARIAAGRDPWRAPAAMQAISRIASGPVLDGMTSREGEPLDDVLASLDQLAADATAREDLRGAAALARSQLTMP
ncbi:MAG: hypothetical protein H6719_03605 [Sandaracinaceae bacterium]|nr:hypothetical protein [Sandaracinaceae bacterium]